MPNKILYDASPSLTTVIHGDDTSPTLKGLSSGHQRLSVEIDNTATLDQFAKVTLKCKGASAFEQYGRIELYLLESTDGTSYETGSDSVMPPPQCMRQVWQVTANGGQQHFVAHLRIPPAKYKLLLVNYTGATFSSVNDENVLAVGHYNDEVQ